MIKKIAEVIKSHISGHTEEDDRERREFVLDGFEEAAAEIDQMYKKWFLDLLPKDEVKSFVGTENISSQAYIHYSGMVDGRNKVRAEIRRKVEG